jgi:predicted phosphoribosyltransferase
MFLNRIHAGKQLAAALKKYQTTSPIVFAISDGGVAVGYEVAKRLEAQLSQVMVQRLPFPGTQKSEFGALAEDESMFLLPAAASTLPLKVFKSIVEVQKLEINRRIKILRRGLPLPIINNKVVILVNDGITLGSVTYAAIYLTRKRQPNKIVIAAPVSSPEVARSLDMISDVHESIILKQPQFFRKISQVYENWHEFTEHEVIAIMQQWRRDYF